MASTIFHHWLDQFHTLPGPRQRRIRAVLWGAGIVVVFLLGAAFGSGFGFPNGLKARVQRLAARNLALQGQIQGQQQQLQTAATALAGLKASLASRDSDLQKLRQEQTFYAKLIGIDGDRSGLGVHSLALTKVPGTEAWNFVATLVDTAENADTAHGNLTLAVEGVRAGKLVTLAWPSLAAPSARDGIPFAFKFFQQVRGSFMLPRGFVPNRIVLTLSPKGGPAITRKLEWSAALAGQHGLNLTTP